MDHYSAYFIIILLSIALGMMLGLMMRPSDEYHGPNAKKESRKIYYNKKNGKFIRFAIKPIECPNPKTRLQKIFGR